MINTQTAATKEIFLIHNNAIATSLLEDGVPKEVIATALMNTEADSTGSKFFSRNWTFKNSTDIVNLPFISATKKYNADITDWAAISMDAASAFRYNAFSIS